MFSAVILNKSSLQSEVILLEIHDIKKSYRRYEWITKIHNGKFVNSFKPNTSYSLRVAIIDSGYDLSESSETDSSLIVGTIIENFQHLPCLKQVIQI